MKKKTIFCSAIIALATTLSLSSCDNKQMMLPEQVGSNDHIVEGLVFVESQDGSVSTLRSAENSEWGDFTGLGPHASGERVTVSFTSKAPWFLYSLYDKSLGEVAGDKTGSRIVGNSKSHSFTVTKNVIYIAVVRKVGSPEFTPRANKSTTTIGSEGGTSHITIKNDKNTPIISKDGQPVENESETGLPPTSMTVKNKPSWVTVTTDPSTGDVSIIATPNNQTDRRTNSKRTGNVVVTVDGKDVTISVSQDSRFEVPADGIESNEWAMKTGDKPEVRYSYNYPESGAAYNISTSHPSFGKNPEKILVAVYINGALANKSEWKEMDATWTYGPVSPQGWITNARNIYTASENRTGRDRGPVSATMTLKPVGSSRTLHTTRFEFTQTGTGFIVDGEIK